jgi:hypothetical protein
VKRLLAAAGLGAVIAWLALPGSPALACSCAAVPLRTQVSGADAVFAARVVAVAYDGDQLDVRARVERVYKGSPPSEVEVRTGSSSAACGLQFSREAEYLMFARSSGGAYTTSLCAGTTDDVAMLDRAGYAGRDMVAVAAPTTRHAVLPSRTLPIAGAAAAFASVFALHARRFARS